MNLLSSCKFSILPLFLPLSGEKLLLVLNSMTTAGKVLSHARVDSYLFDSAWQYITQQWRDFSQIGHVFDSHLERHSSHEQITHNKVCPVYAQSPHSNVEIAFKTHLGRFLFYPVYLEYTIVIWSHLTPNVSPQLKQRRDVIISQFS
jgi:hypothetical protein